MFLGSAPMSLLGVEVATGSSSTTAAASVAMAKVIGAALILGGLGFLAKTFVKRASSRLMRRFCSPIATGDLHRLGGGGGFIVGLTSVGAARSSVS